MPAELASRKCLDGRHRLDSRGDQVHETTDGARVIRWRFALNEAVNHGNDVWLLCLNVSEDSIHRCYNSHFPCPFWRSMRSAGYYRTAILCCWWIAWSSSKRSASSALRT